MNSAAPSTSSAGPFLIALAATCWATDALFRVPTVSVVSPTFIVLFEHIIGTVVLGTWAFFRHREQLRGFSFWTWVSLLLIGAGGSAFATVLFTASFKHVNPSVAILIQKLQPVLVILFALLFLRETPKRNFWIWAPVAVVAGVIVSFPGFDFGFLKGGVDLHSQGVIYAGIAAILWALTTVAGKAAVNHLPPSVVTFWRYFFGLITLVALSAVAGETFPTAEVLRQREIYQSLLYIAFVPGTLGLIFYYNGLSRTTATTAAFVELLFPISAVILNWVFLKQALSPVQVLAGIVLLYSVLRISLES